MSKKTVAILTNFMEFNPGYSLTGIVQDQCKMLQDKGHLVKLFVNSKYNLSPNDQGLFSHNVSSKYEIEMNPVELYRTIPFSHLTDYVSIEDLSEEHHKIVNQTKEMLLEELKDVDVVFTHDFIFTGWFLPYGLGVIEAAKELPDTQFYHWVHSTPTSLRDWWNFSSWGTNHFIVFPNKTEGVRVAEQYRTMPSNVKCIHHIKDLRTWFDFGKDSNDFLRQYPGLLSSDIVQVYPISSDRLSAKRLDIVLNIFSHFKKMDYTVFLVIANQWATGRQRKEDIRRYIEIAESHGLELDKDFVFTSLWEDGKYDTGIPKRMLRDLTTCSNMFIFPTREESFGLIGLEIPLTTAAITVTNQSLQLMNEIHGGFTNQHHFGSFNQNFAPPNLDRYYRDVTHLIRHSFQLNSVVIHRTFIRQKYNWNYLYDREYSPLMGFM